MSALVPSKSSKMHAKTPQLALSRCSLAAVSLYCDHPQMALH